MRKFGTELPGTMDTIIKDAIEKQGFTTKTDMLKFFRQKGASGTPFFLAELSAVLPDWEDMTGAKDPVKYVMDEKLPYRVAKYLD